MAGIGISILVMSGISGWLAPNHTVLVPAGYALLLPFTLRLLAALPWPRGTAGQIGTGSFLDLSVLAVFSTLPAVLGACLGVLAKRRRVERSQFKVLWSDFWIAEVFVGVLVVMAAVWIGTP